MTVPADSDIDSDTDSPPGGKRRWFSEKGGNYPVEGMLVSFLSFFFQEVGWQD